DDCDFSGSTASQLVYAEPHSTVVIRNTVLGDNNYLPLAKASSLAGELPTADSLTNANTTCRDRGGQASQDDTSSSPSSPSTSSSDVSPKNSSSPCSEGSVCLEGDLGVYCQCYLQRSTSKQRCVNGDAAALNLTTQNEPGTMFFPEMLEGDLLLSHVAHSITNTSSSSGGDGDGSGDVTHGGGQFGVVWSVAAPKSSVSGTSMMDWTVFPSTGLLLPGESITLRVVTLPSTSFDGTASVTFKATGLTSGTSPSASQHSNESSLLKDVSGWGSNAKGSASFNVTFYHCATGQAWSPTASSSLDCSEGDTCASCQLCSDVVKKEPEGVNCAEPGATLQTLPVKEGYWRAALHVAYIHGCSNEDACKGGSTVTSVQDYCHEGYMGPECTVCAPGYGRGAANHCHRCTTSFKAGMYFVITTAAVCALVVMALLAVYLVGGRGAVSSTVAGTKDSVRVLQRRTAVLLSRSDLGGRIDFTSPARAGGTRSSGVSGDGKEVPRRFRVRRSSVRGRRSTSSSGGGGGSEIDQDGDRRLEGGPGMRGPGGSLFPAKNNVCGLVVTPGWPGSRINQDGLPTMVPERYSGSPSLPPLPAGGTREARAYEGPPTTRAAGIERSTGNTEQPHLSVQRAEGGRETGVGVRGSGRNTEQAQSSEKHRAREADRDGTAAVKIGNKLAELPLSKIKIVIGKAVVWQISSAFSNITNVAYPPIYEKFLSIIGVFTLDLAWILSASCLTTDVDFYDKLLMVTIGPLIFLGLLVVTFHIGARSRPVRPVATDAPISRNRRGGTQPAIGALQTTEPPTSGLALGKGRTSGTNPEDTATMQTCSEGVVNSGANRPASPGPVERSSGRSQRSLMSVWKAGPGNVADPGQDHLWELFARHTTMTLILLYLIYSQVSTVVFQTFVCEKFPEISKSYLRADQRIECNTSTHMAYSTYAAVMIFLYPLGIPAAFYFLLWRQGSSINPPIHKYLKEQRGTQYVVQEKINQRSKDLGIAPTSFLWNAYYPNRYYFEVFECLRRLVLTGLLVFLVPDTPGQVAFSCVFAFVSLLAFELQRPHIDALEVQLYRTGCLVIFFTNFLALMIKAEVADENSAGSALYAVVLILVNIMFFLSIWWETWATMRATFSRRGFQ
ncbi:unnamed protein product, partial [Laminaria digitata]